MTTNPSDYACYHAGVNLQSASYSGGAGGTFTCLVTGDEDWDLESATPSFSTPSGLIEGMDFSEVTGERVVNIYPGSPEITYLAVGYANANASKMFGTLKSNTNPTGLSVDAAGELSGYLAGGSTTNHLPTLGEVFVVALSYSQTTGKQTLSVYSQGVFRTTPAGVISDLRTINPNHWQVCIGGARTSFFNGWCTSFHVFSRDLHAYDAAGLKDMMITLAQGAGLQCARLTRLNLVQVTTTLDIEVSTTNANGTLYYVVVPDAATAPSAAQIKAGTDGDDNAATAASSVALTTADVAFPTVTGLGNGTLYDVYLVQEDTTYSNVLSGNTAGRVELYSRADDGTGTGLTLASAAVEETSYTDPDGGSNAITIIDNNAGSTGAVSFRGPAVVYDAGENFVRLAAKTVTSSASEMWIRFATGNVSKTRRQSFNITDDATPISDRIGEITDTSCIASIDDLGDGWFQLEWTPNMEGYADTNGIITAYMADSDVDQSVLRDGTNEVAIYTLKAEYHS